jgi:alpha-tubulin suppressor-like RCC1 family protein
MTLYLTKSGSVYSSGFDLRSVVKEYQFGIPRLLKMDIIIKQVSLGKDHALFLSNSFDVYAFGSNHFG